MPIGRLDHYSIRTLDVEASRRFYTEVMGFEVGFRPAFDFPGLWLYNGARYPQSFGVVHIVGIDRSNPDGLKAYLGDRDLDSLNGTGTVDHMAFTATGLMEMRSPRYPPHSISGAHSPRSRHPPGLFRGPERGHDRAQLSGGGSTTRGLARTRAH